MTDTILLTIDQQPVDTPAPFQLMVNMPLNEFKTIVNSTLSNVRFAFDKNFNTPIYSWLESMTDTNAVFWLNLPNGIKAGQQMTVYILFLPLSSEFDGVYAGEAPQLSATYGQFDNGALVFGFYDNFAGTTLNTSKWTMSGVTTSNFVVDNGLTMNPAGISAAAWSTAGIIAANENLFGLNSIVENYASVSVINEAARIEVLLNSNASDENTISNTIVAGIFSSPQFAVQFTSGPATGEPISSFNADTYYIFGIASVGTSVSAYINYSAASSVYSQYGASAIYPAMGFGETSDPNISCQWVRTRAYPPNGVMPTVKIGKYLPLPITISAPQPI